MTAPLYLAPRLEHRLTSLLGTKGFLHQLAGALGSPLNVVLPDQIADNLRRFQEVYERRNLSGKVYFAHKANRSSALVRRLADTCAHIDIASLGELRHALGSGFSPDRIMATGPKSPEFLWLAARTGVTVNLDSADELETLVAIVTKHQLPPARVLVRLSEFDSTGATVLSRRSRFGTPVDAFSRLLDALERHRDTVRLTGIAHHLDTIGLTEKATALESCIALMHECAARGLSPHVIDIGGGFGVNYLADSAQWETFTSELSNAVLGSRPPLTWRNHGYGLRNEGGTLRGALGLYPAHRPLAGPRYLDELLGLQAPSLSRPLATLLLENLHELYIEPGRALVDQCGVVLARVLEVRDNAGGECFVRLEMNASDVSLEEHGVLMDPVLVPRPDRTCPSTGPVGVYLIGNLCLEADFITRRMVFLPHRPSPGDLLTFPNTAGYFMDFSADHALHQPIARKVAAYQDGGRWRWCLDENYWPITSGSEDC
ncbi:Y4yA family PLP-dependent enzyme [Streptomyces poonensis]|uniref:Diaminopimelate decarboxylase n=1 Tax=Streptomyces poonensis TaxID=68255 RepID=A0A918UG68_9ACTN|nr:Y4yA family PLP-dependent enzyme [Streptomyces poonensis]GGZ03498.1 diaminopimelate decarboxylase [Streptomyces poonensis]GLJ90729.1 diaminopimelate decarboxylase [Streptomyces poonensis]